MHITFIYDAANEDFNYFKRLGWGCSLVFHKRSAKCLRVYPSYRSLSVSTSMQPEVSHGAA